MSRGRDLSRGRRIGYLPSAGQDLQSGPLHAELTPFAASNDHDDHSVTNLSAFNCRMKASEATLI